MSALPGAASCPVCGGDNRCGRVRGEESCWCTAPGAASAEVQRIAAAAGVDGRCLCPRCAAGDVPSPCVEVCELDADALTCRGCGRTVDEIAGWPGYGLAERIAVWRRLRSLRPDAAS